MEKENIWYKILHSMKTSVGSGYFSSWLESVKLKSINNEELNLEVPNKFYFDWISDHFLDVIRKTTEKITGKKLAVNLSINKELEKNDDMLIEKPVSVQASNSSSSNEKFYPNTQLIPNFTFENFVIGVSNQFAHAASFATSANPGGTYNPLFIYGGVGLGKTHLLNAIGYKSREKINPNKVFHIHSERFTNELIVKIKHGKMDEFRQKYREHCDLLLLDDVHFLSGKERTQEELFHTFNTLYESRKQVVLTSDRLPKDIPDLEDRLKSRFEWGLIADIEPPELETRVAILKKKADNMKVELPDDVCMFLASNIKSNVRELEGAFIRLEAFSSLTGARLTIDFAKDVLMDIIKTRQKPMGFEDVLREVSIFFNLSITELKSKKRKKNIVYPRQIAMYLLRKVLKMTLPEIGEKFGGKDHTTVIHAINKIENLKEKEENIKASLDSIVKLLEK